MVQGIDKTILSNTILAGIVQEEFAARENREQRQQAATRRQEQGVFRETTRAFGKVAQEHSKREAIKQGVSLGLNLRREISEGRFDGGTFYIVLFLSLIKDLIDIVSLGTIGVLVNIVITIALYIIFFLKKSRLKRFLIKRYIWPVIVESIPFISVFPVYTVSTILLKIKADKKTKGLESQTEEVEKETANLKKKLS